MESLLLTAALEAIEAGENAVEMRDSLTGAYGAERLAKALGSDAVPVAWTLDRVKKAGEAFSNDNGTETGYGPSAVSALANVRSLSARIGLDERHVLFGLTSDPEDDHTFAHGYGLGLFPDGAYSAAKTEKKIADCNTSDVFRLTICNGKVTAYKNDTELVVMGEASHVIMHAKLFFYEDDAFMLVPQIMSYSRVSQMNLNGNLIGNKGLEHIAAHLETETCLVSRLDLGLNQLRDAGVERLCVALENENCKIRSLDLSGNEITDEGARRLGQILGKSTCPVTWLGLSGNDIEDDGAIAIAEALEQEACGVTSVELALNGIGDVGLMRLAEAMEKDECRVATIKVGPGNRFGKAARRRFARAIANTPRLNL